MQDPQAFTDQSHHMPCVQPQHRPQTIAVGVAEDPPATHTSFAETMRRRSAIHHNITSLLAKKIVHHVEVSRLPPGAAKPRPNVISSMRSEKPLGSRLPIPTATTRHRLLQTFATPQLHTPATVDNPNCTCFHETSHVRLSGFAQHRLCMLSCHDLASKIALSLTRQSPCPTAASVQTTTRRRTP